MRSKRSGVLVASLIGLAVMLTACGEAEAGRPKKVREEIAALKAQIAQIQSQSDYQLRLIAGSRGAPSGPGGLCSDPCSLDSDGDGINDCEDLCPCDPATTDGDGDGTPDCADPCPDDATDACIDPCRQDSDGDGLNDCQDPCPFDPSAASDGDGDGIPDCADPCPLDKNNACGGICLLDADGDGTKDCGDPCPFGTNEGRPCVSPGPVPAPGGAPGTGVGRASRARH